MRNYSQIFRVCQKNGVTLCYIAYLSRKFYTHLEIFQAFVHPWWTLTYFILRQNVLAVDTHLLAKHIHQRRCAKKREDLPTHFRSLWKIRFEATWEMASAFPSPKAMNARYRWVNQKDHITSRAGFSPSVLRSGLLGGRKMRRWRGPLFEKRAFARRSGILIVTNSARKGSRAKDYPFYIAPLILLFMNLASERSGRPFCFWTKGVAINMLDCV